MDVGLASAKEFIPTGFVVKTAEQFPDLDDLEDSKPKKKKKGKGKGGDDAVAVKAKVDDEQVDETLKWKGKPSSFFVMQPNQGENTDPGNNPMNFELNDE